jgi:hypothetical protein
MQAISLPRRSAGQAKVKKEAAFLKKSGAKTSFNLGHGRDV